MSDDQARAAEEVLGPRHPTRHRIAQCIRLRPGCYLQQICNALAINRGTATHHLGVLERSGRVESVQAGPASASLISA